MEMEMEWPGGNFVVNFSGGRSSGMMLVMLVALHDGQNYLGNCQACFLKSESALVQVSIDAPEVFAKFEQMEYDSGRTFSNRFSYAQIRAQQDLVNLPGALCQENDGECTM